MLPILMALRVRGRTTSAELADAAGLTLADARARLGDATAGGLVRDEGGLVLTAAGRAELAALLAGESSDRVALAALYDEFLATDSRFKTCITAWQLAAATPSRSEAALGELRTVAAESRALVERLVAVVPRFAGYARRLAAAADALARGDTRFVASPRVDSLHQVWFELHEDLLVTLGRERAA
jgi:DNA-binding Lrp family transcriptional regulator